MKIISLVAVSTSIFLCLSTEGYSQNKEKDSYKKEKHSNKEYKEKHTDKDKLKESENKDRGDISIEINLPRIPSPFPHPFPGNPPSQATNVPPGHYPPPGECRVWYPDRPAGHQPPPQSCSSLRGVRLTDNAFILYADKAYDSEYDWWEYEQKYPVSVAEQILDILFPNKRRN